MRGEVTMQIAAVLEKAGVITDRQMITRIVIDLRGGCEPRIYVERLGDERLIDIAAMLAGAEVFSSG